MTFTDGSIGIFAVEKNWRCVTRIEQGPEVCKNRIEELREKRQTLLVEDASLSSENERINELIDFIRNNRYRTLV